MRVSASLAVVVLSSAGAGSCLAQTADPPQGHPVVIDGVKTVCTGTGQDARENPRWRDYPFKLEFVGRNGHYLGDEVVRVSGRRRVVSVHCDGPWVLMKLPPGSYRVVADVAQAGRKVMNLTANSHVVVRFPDAGGPGSAAPSPGEAGIGRSDLAAYDTEYRDYGKGGAIDRGDRDGVPDDRRARHRFGYERARDYRTRREVRSSRDDNRPYEERFDRGGYRDRYRPDRNYDEP